LNKNIDLSKYFHISFSKIKTFETCKLQYFYTYIYKIRTFDYNYYNILGILTHFFIERMIEADYMYKDIYNKYSDISKLREALFLKNFNDEQIISYSESKDVDISDIDSKVTTKIDTMFNVLEQLNYVPLYQAFKFVKQSEAYIHEIKNTYKDSVFPEIEYIYIPILKNNVNILYN